MKIAAAIHDMMFSSKVNAAAAGQPVAWLPRGTPMAPWAGELSEAELSAVAYYVRTFYAGGAP